MMTMNSYYLGVLIAGNVALLALVCLTLMKFERRCRRIEEFWDSPTGVALADDNIDGEIHAQVMATRRLEQRLGELQRSLKLLEIKAPKEQAPTQQRVLPIENAMRMAQHGATIDDLTRNCGLNIGEARLMQKLHGSARLAANGN